ncbi:MAG: hypothetical protein IT305_18625 [Chloroflexi bacterium]|nr:hypothetical protein [Chloroflexota bacterium]
MMPLTSARSWSPPSQVSRDEIVAASRSVLARPERTIEEREDLFRIQALGLDWDVGCVVVAPAAEDAAVGPDGRRIGVFLLHGGGGDHRSKVPMARFLARRFGYTVACMTYPGHLYLDDPSHDWPGDTIEPDGSVRTPVWLRGERFTPDQYELIQDRSDQAKRAKWGTLFFLRAKPGTPFFDRMAAWPGAFEDAMTAVCQRYFPPEQFSIYAHGHSTGGPFVHMLLQRVENVAGLIGMESSPFGEIYSRMLGMSWDFPFTDLTIRTWRHIAKYVGSEAGPDGAWKLPWLMEDVFDAWERSRKQPQFKAEYLITYGNVEQLGMAARAVARRLDLSADETDALVRRFQSYPAPLTDPAAQPLPPLLYGIAGGSRDHTVDRYTNVILPTYEWLERKPRANLVVFQAGVHGYEKAEDDLPNGVLPAVAALWDEAISAGYFLP